MSSSPGAPTTGIATATAEDVFVRGKSLCQELIGRVTFTEMIVFQMLGRMPSAAEVRVIDGCLVTIMEHGLTPSALATRLVYSSAPEAMQSAVAAGLLAVGSVFVGTTEGCGALLARLLRARSAAGEGATRSEAMTSAMLEEARTIAREHRAGRTPVPGFGHPLHKPDDPRSIRLLALARETGVAGAHVEAVEILGRAVDEVYGKHVTLNATGAIAALLGDCGVPPEILRGFALIARAAGLVGHVREEQQTPAMRAIWQAAEAAIPYRGDVLTSAAPAGDLSSTKREKP
jgi:citrate synthase